ncbi:type II secretion protein E (plasmid) [Candidatus Williamhamiltonella defendens]|uniref:Type II secretion protein E n=1 Tax=Candidatus Williamhamiltonella defendens TaxID=138072 RepID=A0AAC9VMP2_9ENTR|nr:ATPase, T2SS/T4P/T4SS family [Candidatus Hamiltonella defensa]ASV34606.1 type II secretion protein E [Candidatus Hamiltonella defensa]AWK17569.1 type II secretion protein E [Candidatus Hamiltonella defensa]
MFNALPQPDADIARFVRVTQAEDGMIDMVIADNYREDFKVQHFVSRVQKAFPGRSRWASLSLDDIAHVALPPSGDAPAHSVNQQRVSGYFRKAIALSASDVHLTVGRDGGEFCYMEARVHGELHCMDCIDRDEGMALASTIILSMCDVTEKQFYPHLHQDGRIAERFLKPLGIFGARYAHMPAVGGLYVVMRLIKEEGEAVPDFESLGFLPDQVRVLKRLLRRPEGMIILSGPTGSGKSTTLRTASAAWLALWGYINRLPVRRLLTIEDPPEGRIDGAIQTPIIADKKNPEEIKRAWLLSMSYALRCDPDAILNGEIRDLESALTALKAAMTGHLVMTTLHANDGLNILERLEIEGVSARLLADPQLLIGLISQRLVQRLCPHCKVPYQQVAGQLEADDRNLIEHHCQPEKVLMRHVEGCAHCYHGIAGRMVVAEVIAPDAPFFELYRTKSRAAAKTYWHRTLGGVTRNQHVLHYIHAGEVDPLAAHCVCPIDEDSYTLLP